MEGMNTPFGNYTLAANYAKRQKMLSFKSEVPVAMGSTDSVAGPMMTYGPDGSVRIQNREYLTDVLASGDLDFQILFTYLTNPSLVSNFPWLSGVAVNFEKFCYNYVCYHYVTQSSTSAPGCVMIVPDYDPQSTPPASKAQALTLKDSVRAPPWQEACCVLPLDRLCSYAEYFVKLGTDHRLSNPATVYICTSGASDSPPIQGEIWVEYDIVLSIPASVISGFDLFKTAGESPFKPFAAPITVFFDGFGLPRFGTSTFYTAGTNVFICPANTYYFVSFNVTCSTGLGACTITSAGIASTATLMGSSSTAVSFTAMYIIQEVDGTPLQRALQFNITTGGSLPTDSVTWYCGVISN